MIKADNILLNAFFVAGITYISWFILAVLSGMHNRVGLFVIPMIIFSTTLILMLILFWRRPELKPLTLE